MYRIVLLLIIFLTAPLNFMSYQDYGEIEIETVAEEFVINSFDDTTGIYENDFSFIDEDGENLKEMLEHRNSIIVKHKEKSSTVSEDIIEDYFEYQDILVEEDYAYVTCKYTIESNENSVDDYGEEESTETGKADEYEILLKKNSDGEWKILQAKSNNLWNKGYIAEDTPEEDWYSEVNINNLDNMSPEERMEKLKNFKYDVSEENLKKIEEQYENVD